MDSHNDLLGELAGDAALERADFIRQSAEQLRKFLDHHRDRIASIGGLTLIDEEPDYLSIAPDLTFRSRSRYLDDTTGEWVSETEVIESASELVELYNPADIYAAFAEAAREAAGLPAEPTAEGDLYEIGRDLARGDGHAGRGSVRGRRRLVGGRAADLADRGRRRVGRAPAVRPRARVPGAQPAQRGAPARGVRGGVGRADLGDRRPDHRRRRRRAADADRGRHVPGRGHPRGLRGGLADARRRRRAGRVLRPDRRVRRPGRRARRGIPGGRARARAGRQPRRRRGDAADGADAGARSRRPTPATTTRTSRPRDDAAGCGGARRQSGDPAGPVAPGVSRAGPRGRLPRGPVRPRPDRRLLGHGPAPPVLAQHGRSGHRHRDDPFPGDRPRDRVVHPAAAGRPDRPARAARPAVRGGSAEPAPAARRRRAGDGRRPDAGRRGDPRRAAR